MSTKAPRRGKVERKVTFIHDVRKPKFSHEKKRNEIRPFTTHKTNSKWIAELSLGILEENIGGSSLRLGLAMISLISTSKV